MPVDDHTTFSSDELASHLETSLTAGKDFTIPAVDLDQPAFDIPAEIGNSLYDAIVPLTELDLTSREVGGTGMFDGLMVAVSAHIHKEYQAGRLTGEQYAKAYVEMTTTVLNSSVSYLLAKDQSYWQAQLAQVQARVAEIAVVESRVKLETARVELAMATIEASSAEINYAVNKIKLSNEDMQYALGKAQLAQVTYQTANTLPAQLAQILKTTEISDYQLDFILPKEVDKATKAIETATAEISKIVAQKDQVLYQNSAILPSQNSNIIADTTQKTYQTTNLLPAQLAGLTADNVGKVYNNTYLLPANLIGITENNEAARAKTLNTRSDLAPVAGAMGKQNDLYTQQIASYKRSDEAKVAKMYLDNWLTVKSLDPNANTPSSLDNPEINSVMNQVRSSVDF